MNLSRYYGAISVGTLLSELLTNTKYRDKSLRFYSDVEDTFFKYPYLLVSAGHNYKRENFRDSIGFPKISPDNKQSLLVDSGGFQLAKGVISEEKYNDAMALKWSEDNGDIFPILDRPPIATGFANNSNEFREKFKFCLKKSVISAKFYADNRTRNDAVILNVLQGRTLADRESWYNLISKFPLDGWGYGGNFSLKGMISALLFIKSKGELDRKKTVYYHILGVSKLQSIIYLTYLQHLFNISGRDVIISFDSSYPFKTCAFGNYFTFPHLRGINQFAFSNVWKDLYAQKLTKEHRLPCTCSVCSTVDDVNEFLQDPKLFYVLTSLHNFSKLIEYKKIIENIIEMDIEELYDGFFPADIRRNMKIIKAAFEMPGYEGLNYLEREIREETESKTENISEMF